MGGGERACAAKIPWGRPLLPLPLSLTLSLVDFAIISPSAACMNTPISTTISGGPCRWGSGRRGKMGERGQRDAANLDSLGRPPSHLRLALEASAAEAAASAAASAAAPAAAPAEAATTTTGATAPTATTETCARATEGREGRGKSCERGTPGSSPTRSRA
jgi:hypothetical protein